MKVKRTKNKLYENLWKVLVAFLAILGAAGAVVTIVEFLKEDKTEVTYEVARERHALNLYKDVKGLEILFRKEDIVKKELSLKLLSLEIVNTGDKHIKKGDFDTNNPWKIKIIDDVNTNSRVVDDENIDSKAVNHEHIDTKIVGVTIVSTSDSYFEKELKKVNMLEKYIELPFFMFDKDESFTLEVVVLHKKDTPVKLEMGGKISGMDQFTFVDNTSEKTGKLLSFLIKVFQGGIGIHLVRYVVYSIIIIIIGIILIALFEYFEKKKINRTHLSRKRDISQHLSNITNRSGGDIIVAVYLSDGNEGLKELKNALSPDILRFSALASKVEVDYRRHFEGIQKVPNFTFVNPNLSGSIGAALRNLMDKSLIYQKDDNWVLDEDFRDLLNKSIERLSSNA